MFLERYFKWMGIRQFIYSNNRVEVMYILVAVIIHIDSCYL